MTMRGFTTCRRGNFAVAFALASVPVLGAAGAAIDYSRAVNVHSFVQAQADMAALAGAQVGIDGDHEPYLNYLVSATEQRYGPGQGIEGINVNAEWVSEYDFTVEVTGGVPVTILAAVPGFPDAVQIGVVATARIAEPSFIYSPPTMTELDNEAGDYNQLSVYCFNPAMQDDPETLGRTQMTPISDNAGTSYSYEMPRCQAGEMLSFKLLNVRLVREKKHLWHHPGSTRFEYFTDTQILGGAEDYDLDDREVLETVLCDRPTDCEKKSKGGIIPEGKDRIPERATEVCSPGKYMYYGWEDRPPGMEGPAESWEDIAWTDRDYDDIRIVIACPSLDKVEDRMVRLIR
jgi:Flp pilus assembly protein TadG